MLFFRAGIHKYLVRVPNREDPVNRLLLQKQSDLGLPFLAAISDQNFRTFTVIGKMPLKSGSDVSKNYFDLLMVLSYQEVIVRFHFYETNISVLCLTICTSR